MIEDSRGSCKNVGFQNAVLQSFKWLVDYRYRVVEEKSTFIRYEGPSGYVNVYHGRSSYEVGIEVGPPGKGVVSSYSMSELIRLSNIEEARIYRNPVVTTMRSMNDFVDAQAQRLREYGQRVLTGDAGVWEELQQQKQQWAKDFATEVLLSQIRPEAERAFRDHDFKRVVDLLSAVASQLTPAERKKLDFARRKAFSRTPGQT